MTCKLDDFKIDDKIEFYNIIRKGVIVFTKFLNGDKTYYDNAGFLHREDGPAIDWPNWPARTMFNYFLHGRVYTKEEWEKAVKD